MANVNGPKKVESNKLSTGPRTGGGGTSRSGTVGVCPATAVAAPVSRTPFSAAACVRARNASRSRNGIRRAP